MFLAAARRPRRGDATSEGTLPNVSIENLLESGVHFGHQTKRWNPKMKKFIFAERNGIHIIDLNKTFTQIQIACGFIHDLVTSGKRILFVGTKKQAQQEIKAAALRTGMPFVVDRWLGGTLTNLQTIRKSVKRLKQLERTLESPDTSVVSKKELASLRREQTKLHKNLNGIVNMENNPGAMFVVDIQREEIAIREAQRLRIPIIALVDTNCDPDQVAYPIAGNDDAIRSIKVITNIIADAVAEAQAEIGAQVPPPQVAPVEAQPVQSVPAPMPAVEPAVATPPTA
jgi:small subunit ribosomal protein S2